MDPRSIAPAWVIVPGSQDGPTALNFASCEVPSSQVREQLALARAQFTARFQSGSPARDLIHEQAMQTDQVLQSAWQRFALQGNPSLALVAVGGYGRRELHPGSDVDLLVLLREEPDPDLSQCIQGFIAFLWDIGLEVGHSVRTLDQCVVEARRDLTVVTNLMEARLIDGPHQLLDKLEQRLSPAHLWSSRAFFEAKRQEQQRRHHKYHDTAYNLEPNVKEGPGGLRDIQVVGWVARRHFGAQTLQQLVEHGFLTDSEYEALINEQDFLWQVRYALHVLTGRREDRLLFDYQRAIAEEFGYRDQDHHLAVEQFMKRYYRSIGELDRLNEMLLELFEEVTVYADAPVEIVPIDHRFEKRFQSRNGFLEVAHDKVFKQFPLALLELFLVLQLFPALKGVRASTIRLVRDHRYLIDEQFRYDIRARRLFLEILRQPRGLSHELRRMHRYGVLSAYLPVFGAVVGQMQYDLFHVYTVDEHSLFVVRNLRTFAVPEKKHELPLCSAIFQRLPKPELLYIAGLFHDIAKGRGGDHSELGADDALQFCRHHGMSHYDGRLVAWLVKYHLIMSMTAQRQDISDPQVIAAFAGRVRDRIHLDYLYLLTVADIRATNPTLWNDWKDALLRDLYDATLRALRRGLENPVDRSELISETQAEAWRLLSTEKTQQRPDLREVETLWEWFGEDYFLRFRPDEIAWHTRAIIHAKPSSPLVLVRQGRGVTEVFVYTKDQDNLFAAMTSILSRLGLTIHDARILTANNGMTLDSYAILEEGGEAITDPGREHEICAVLRDRLRAPQEALVPVNRLAKRQLKHFPIEPRVYFYPDERNNRTVMEVIAGDRPGLLATIASAMVTCKMRVQNAKIATLGERAEDLFFITDSCNQPLTESVKICLQQTVLDALREQR
ncbi:MAG: [protein-PII] uridylyltransferase [Gammaproteobacteria bacterium]